MKFVTNYRSKPFHLKKHLTDLEVFSIIVAAIVHDYKHPGTTNHFEEKFNTEIYKKYKHEPSLLEKYSVDKTFEVIKRTDCNITQNLTSEQFKEFKFLIETLVRSTDIYHHFKHLDNLINFLKNNAKSSLPDNKLTMCWILHCADICNTAKGTKFSLIYF